MEIRKIKIESVSKEIYKVEPFPLSSTTNSRTVFCPVITPKGIDGQIIYEKKDSDGNWVTEKSLNRQTMKKGEWTKVQLSTQELAALINYTTSLEEFKKTGLTDAFNHFLIIGMFKGLTPEEIEKVKLIINEKPTILRKIIEIDEKSEIDVGSVLSAFSSNFTLINSFINNMDDETLKRIRMASNLRVLNTAELEKLIDTNATEEEFQQYFTKHQELLCMAIPSLVHFVSSKPYCGGKDISGSGGTYGDFLYSEQNNICFIEIKTPKCSLVTGKKYREGIKEISPEICNAVVQVKHEKDTFYKNSNVVYKGKNFFDPKCYVIAGLTKSLSDDESKATFELYKASLSNVTIITYDELVLTLKRLLSILTE